jgi:putative oxidoreductase
MASVSDRVTRFALGARETLLPFLARILISAIFVQGALGKIFGWSSQVAYMRSHGIGFTRPLLAVALFIEALGVVCLLSGYAARIAAAVMFAYLVAISVLLHAFWSAPGGSGGMAQTQFMKNMGIAGGLLLLAAYGPGRWKLPPVRRGVPQEDRAAGEGRS